MHTTVNSKYNLCFSKWHFSELCSTSSSPTTSIHNPYSHNMVASDHACLFRRATRAIAASLASNDVKCTRVRTCMYERVYRLRTFIYKCRPCLNASFYIQGNLWKRAHSLGVSIYTNQVSAGLLDFCTHYQFLCTLVYLMQNWHFPCLS